MDRKTIDPSKFNLNNRTVLVEIRPKHIGIVKNRKSRIIMKDGEKILNIAIQIKLVFPNTKVSLITNAQVCSKTAKYLLENEIEVIHENM